MTLELLGLLVIFGISGIVLLVHFTGGSRGTALSGDDAVLRAWHADWPHCRPLRVDRNGAETAALVSLPDNGLGLIWSFGADTVSRRLTVGSVRMLTPRAGALVVRFSAFDCPTAHIPLTRRELPEWHATLSRYLPQEVSHG